MNIFILDPNPYVAASKMHPKHYGLNSKGTWGCPKMALEALQMLAGAYHTWGWKPLLRLDGTPYSPNAHPHHRCSRWVREDPRHAWWTLRHALALCERHHNSSGREPSIQTTVTQAILEFNIRTHGGHTDEPRRFVVADGIQPHDARFTAEEAVQLYTAYYERRGLFNATRPND